MEPHQPKPHEASRQIHPSLGPQDGLLGLQIDHEAAARGQANRRLPKSLANPKPRNPPPKTSPKARTNHLAGAESGREKAVLVRAGERECATDVGQSGGCWRG